MLPSDRIVGSRAFVVIGVDYAGPLYYKMPSNRLRKCYILLFSCSLSRAIHLQPSHDQTTEEFIRSSKLFVARRGRPRKIYNDKAKTFNAAANWVNKVVKNEAIDDFLADWNNKKCNVQKCWQIATHVERIRRSSS